MGQLDADVCALLVDELRELLQPGDVLIAPDAEVLRRNASLRGYRRRLHDKEADATDRTGRVMHLVPVVHLARFVAAGVHAHRGHHDAVLEGYLLDRIRGKQHSM